MNVLVLLGAIAAASGVALGLSLRRRKTAEEKERERRLKVNTVGRICDGSIERLAEDSAARRVIYYNYSVRGVSYSAAQDVTPLAGHINPERCLEGFPASIKYDPQNPSNSIVVCELWSGIR